jgi:hypothetical protein
MAEQVKAIKEGKSISKPIYNHVTGNLDDPEEIQPSPIFVRPQPLTSLPSVAFCRQRAFAAAPSTISTCAVSQAARFVSPRSDGCERAPRGKGARRCPGGRQVDKGVCAGVQ